ncbi:hypothetical protein C7T94_11645 [Pedobacter yulinensis]|uniref:F5/8 type C domain-containing protein n=1 Tax=Pedobacter yulinensis TaxID=2126353 RepID=A0A2T3HLD9_9SPHI|nr:ThuA domain-containing protein [Pedobacter yulinensis]PST83239.1 hypothetical protein C7T94_11645 [Pedobacter yulinensis]
MNSDVGIARDTPLNINHKQAMTNASIQLNWDAQTKAFVNHRFNRPCEARIPGNSSQNFRSLLNCTARSGLRQFLLLLALMCIAAAVRAQELPRALLITGNGNIPNQLDNYPPWTHDFHNDVVIQILDQIVEIDTTTDMKDLNAENLRKYDLVISNSMFLTPDEKQLNALWAFVADGKSYLTLHSGILSCLNWDKYETFIGGFFVGGPSTEPQTLRVYTSNYEFWGFPLRFRSMEQHPVSRTLEDFDTKDELYYFQPTKKEIDVIARSENHPVMWSHQVGKGRVMCLTLGHDEAAKKAAGYQELLKNGVRWLTGYPLIYSDKWPPVSDRKKVYHDFVKLDALSDNPGVSALAEGDATFLLLRQNDRRNLDLVLGPQRGMATFGLRLLAKKGRESKRTVTMQVVPDGEGNIARYYGNTIAATTAENLSPLFDPRNMIDGDTLSRWSSKKCDEAFVLLDLEKKYNVSKIKILWEASYAKKYEILSSTDNKNWKSIYSNQHGRGGMEEMPVKTTARYLKVMLQEKPPGKRGFSIYELEVYR